MMLLVKRQPFQPTWSKYAKAANDLARIGDGRGAFPQLLGLSLDNERFSAVSWAQLGLSFARP
jgi:hypothetical protein